MRSVIDLDAVERARAYCPCRALLGEWRGLHRPTFDAEDPALPSRPD